MNDRVRATMELGQEGTHGAILTRTTRTLLPLDALYTIFLRLASCITKTSRPRIGFSFQHRSSRHGVIIKSIILQRQTGQNFPPLSFFGCITISTLRWATKRFLRVGAQEQAAVLNEGASRKPWWRQQQQQQQAFFFEPNKTGCSISFLPAAFDSWRRKCTKRPSYPKKKMTRQIDR